MTSIPQGPMLASGFEAKLPARKVADAEDGRRFRDLLGQDPLSQDTRKAEEQAREAAEQLLSVSFIQPVLKQVREMNNAPAPWGPTQAEKQFGPMLDARLAEELIRAARLPVVDRLAKDLNRFAAPDELEPEMPERKGLRS